MKQPLSPSWHEQARAGLVGHLQRHPQPSQQIEQWCTADAHCAEVQKVLRRLLDHAPRITRVVSQALRTAFELEPTDLLFIEQLPAPQPPRIDTLLDRAMLLMRRGLPAAYIDAYTSLSFKDDAQRKPGFTAYQALHRVGTLKLSSLLDKAAEDYWQQLAYGSALTRQQRWRQLYPAFLADKALLAHAVNDLSDHGLALFQRLVDAPSPSLREQAGGAWARLAVRPLVWAGAGTQRVTISGGLHLTDATLRVGGLQVVFIPGLSREFHEFASQDEMSRHFSERLEAPDVQAIWARLALGKRHEVLNSNATAPLPLRLAPVAALTGNALEYCADDALHTQWANEQLMARAFSAVHGVPPPSSTQHGLSSVERARELLTQRPSLKVHLDFVLRQDAEYRRLEISFSQHRGSFAQRWQDAALKAAEDGLVALLDKADVGADSKGWDEVVSLRQQWQDQSALIRQLIEGHGPRFVEHAFWQGLADTGAKRHAVWVLAQRAAWRAQTRIQQHLGWIDAAMADGLSQLLSLPRGRTEYRAVEVSIGTAGTALQPLMGVFAITTGAALTDWAARQSVVLCVPGLRGGMQAFGTLDDLSRRLEASLRNPHNPTLWSCVARNERLALKARVAALSADQRLQVYFAVNEGDLLLDCLKAQVRQHMQTDAWVGQGGRPFTEVSDLALTRQLLAAELADQLQLPSDTTLELAMTHVSLLRLASAEAKALPTWLASASRSVRKRYRCLQSRYLHSAQAFERTLWQRLPDLYTYAREALISRLTRDGFYPQLNLDQPLLDIPDDVTAQWKTHPERPVGDSGSQLIVSPQRSRYSLLQLALANLDPEAPWTRWRLQFARYLDPAWKDRLSADYLIKTIAELDVGGRYEQALEQLFQDHPPDGVSSVLLYRPHEQQAEWALFNAQAQGLSAFAEKLFTTAMSARTAEDLNRHGYRLQLCSVRLVGHTLQHHRHVAGMVVMRDDVSGRCVIYWPGAPSHPAIRECADVEQARHTLMSQGGTAVGISALAKNLAPGWEEPALASYPRAIRQVAPGINWQRLGGALTTGMRHPLAAIGLLAQTLIGWFRIKRSHPALDLQGAEEEVREQREAAPNHWLEIIPTTACHTLAWLAQAQVFELLRQVRSRSGSRASLKAYREWRLGEQADARLRGLLAFVPGISIGVNLYELLLALRRFHHSRDAHDALDVGFQTLISLLDVATYRVPAGKVRLRGTLPVRPALNRLRQPRGNVSPGGAAVIGERLAHYRRELAVNDGIALKGPHDKDCRVKHGQQFFMDGEHAYAIYRRENERTLRLKSPDNDGQNELLLRIEEPRHWLLGADAPPPQPGPSTGVRRPWELAVGGTEWQPPDRLALPRVLQQPVLTNSTWQSWGLAMADDPPVSFSLSRRLYRVHGERSYDVVKLGRDYFELLPSGSKPTPDVIFIKRTEPLARHASDDFARWLSTHHTEQPIALTFGDDGLWTPRQPLFTHRLSDTIGAAFPGITPDSARFAAHRLVELADTERSMTATRLLSIRATLDDWLPPPPAMPGRTDDLFQMLRPQHRVHTSSINIGLEGMTAGFERLDFQLPDPLLTGLLLPGASVGARSEAIQGAIRQIVERQGFRVWTVRKGNQVRAHNFILTHPNSNNLYYLFTCWTQRSTVSLALERRLILTDAWFRSRIDTAPVLERPQFAALKDALEQGRLVRMLAGIQLEEPRPPTVFFVKLQVT